MKLIQLLISILMVSHSISSAQMPYYNQRDEFLKANRIWAFGLYAGLDFNSGTPLPIKTEASAVEGGASVSNPITGSLLFYVSGKKCYNANHQSMSNAGLLAGGNSTVQGACIVPVIDSPGKYYVFSLNGFTNVPDSRGALFYSVVDMNLNNGLGDLVMGRMNIVLDTDTLSESMIAIPGDNCDVWLMVHALGKPIFKAYHITKDGINPIPIISVTGTQIQGGPILVQMIYKVYAYAQGGMAVSSDRQKIAISSIAPMCYMGDTSSFGGVLLSKFDAGTGVVSESILVGRNQTYRPDFSPDNSKLYLTHLDYVNDSFLLQQYDVSTYDSAAIARSMKVIGQIPKGNRNSYSGSDNSNCYLRQYNGKIYINECTGFQSLGIINQPN